MSSFFLLAATNPWMRYLVWPVVKFIVEAATKALAPAP